jgi:hypothetical protein
MGGEKPISIGIGGAAAYQAIGIIKRRRKTAWRSIIESVIM